MNEFFKRILKVVDWGINIFCIIIPIFVVSNRGTSESFLEMLFWGVISSCGVYIAYSIIIYIITPLLKKGDINFKQTLFLFFKNFNS